MWFTRKDRETLDRIEAKLAAILALLVRTQIREEQLMVSMDDVLQRITEESDVVTSVGLGVDAAIAKLVELRALVAAGGTDPAKIQQALDAIDASKSVLQANKDRLGNAVDANT